MFFTSTKWWFDRWFQLLIVCIAFYPINGIAQVLQPKRFEIPLVSHQDNYGIESASKHGLYLYRVFEGPQESQLHLIKLDT